MFRKERGHVNERALLAAGDRVLSARNRSNIGAMLLTASDLGN